MSDETSGLTEAEGTTDVNAGEEMPDVRLERAEE
jgi:hypothetical protein